MIIGTSGRTDRVYLFIYGSLNDAESSSGYIALNDRMTVNNEFEIIWTDAVLLYQEVLSSHLLGETGGNYEKPQSR
jgi:hypothetical protein